MSECCGACGTQNEGTSNFCQECGTKIPDSYQLNVSGASLDSLYRQSNKMYEGEMSHVDRHQRDHGCEAHWLDTMKPMTIRVPAKQVPIDYYNSCEDNSSDCEDCYHCLGLDKRKN